VRLIFNLREFSINDYFYPCSKVYHVRSVTQGDVIRADAKEIPRIFQLLYAGEGASHRPDEQSQLDVSVLHGNSNEERPGTIVHKGEMALFKKQSQLI